MAGQVEVSAGQVNLMGSLPRSASNVLEPMLHPVNHAGILSTVSIPLIIEPFIILPIFAGCFY